jgi:serine/threonine-protein kinase
MDVQQGSFGEVFGSSLYIAPEQARRSADAVPQSDQYSLGVILYQALTGALPFDDPSPASVALQHMTRTPPPPRQLNPALNVETENVLLKALSKSPSDRFVSCRALLDALEQALSGSLPLDKTLVSRSTLLGAGDETLIGLQLDEYRIEALLGHGGMARLYRGRDTRLNRLAAIKVIDVPFRTDADYVARFKREAQAIALLDHPNIVRLYRSGEVSGMLYMAMQYVTGRDLQLVLDELHQNNARLSNDRVQRLIAEVGAALDYAHTKGIIHRDVKPSNIIIDQQERAILTDFGLALLVDSGTRGEIFGSPYYISPEQAISSANVTRQSDLYSLGVILYELLTGQVPFTADNPLDVAMLHMTETPRPPSQLSPQITPAVEAVVLKALAKEPRDRYQSGEELAQALKQALRAAPVAATPIVTAPAIALYDLPPIPAAVAVPSAQPVAPPQPIVKRKGRKRLGCVTLLLLLAMLLAGAGVLLAQNQETLSPLIAALIAPPAATETSTATPSATPSTMATIRPDTLTPTKAAAILPSLTPTATRRTPTSTMTPTRTATSTATPSATPSVTGTVTLTATGSLTLTLTPGGTSTLSGTPTLSGTLTLSATPTPTQTITPSAKPGPPYRVYLPIVMNRYRARR